MNWKAIGFLFVILGLVVLYFADYFLSLSIYLGSADICIALAGMAIGAYIAKSEYDYEQRRLILDEARER